MIDSIKYIYLLYYLYTCDKFEEKWKFPKSFVFILANCQYAWKLFQMPTSFDKFFLAFKHISLFFQMEKVYLNLHIVVSGFNVIDHLIQNLTSLAQVP